jgi:hypothetical protein
VKQCKSIDIIGKSWRDRVYGNTYQSARVIIDLDANGEGKTYHIGFSASHYMDEAGRLLEREGYIPRGACITAWCREHGIVVRYGVTDALQREVKAWGKPNE